MALKIPVLRDTVHVRYKGVYDYENLYKYIIQFLEDRKFDVNEKKYKDKEAGPFGHEIEHRWVAEREVTPLIQYKMNVNTHLWDVKEFKADTQNGSKLLTSGKFHIMINGTIIFDWQNSYTSNFWSWFLDFYVTKLFKDYYEQEFMSQLEGYCLDLQRGIKKQVKMEAES